MFKSRIYIIGNWKSNKNREDVESWFEDFARQNVSYSNNIEGVICPTFLHLELAQSLIKKYNLTLKLGAQDVSPFEIGSFTGEVAASQLAKVVSFVIIGHSERRTKLGEDDKLLEEKVKRAKEANLTTVFCVQDENTYVPPGVDIIAYEPVWAIGSGKSDTPENANHVSELIKQKNQAGTVIYGGSVTPDNVVSFIKMDHIDGVLPGGASLDPIKFAQMISQCTN